MFNFNLKPGHATPADGLLDSVGALELTGRLVAGHSSAADGLLSAATFYQATTVVVGPPSDVISTIAGALRLNASASAQEVLRGGITGGLNLSASATAREVNQGAVIGGLTLTGSADARQVNQAAITGALTLNCAAAAQQADNAVTATIAGGLQLGCTATAAAEIFTVETPGTDRIIFWRPTPRTADIRGALQLGCDARGRIRLVPSLVVPGHEYSGLTLTAHSRAELSYTLRTAGGLTLTAAARGDHYDRNAAVRLALAALEL